jgi:hypothetical protein
LFACLACVSPMEPADPPVVCTLTVDLSWWQDSVTVQGCGMDTVVTP